MQQDQEEIEQYKLIFLGDQSVGKSSILNRFANDKFEPNYQVNNKLIYTNINKIK
jgi:GTPase SAR1 family protein